MTILGVDNGMLGCLAFLDDAELILHDMPTYKIKDRNHLDIPRIKQAR